jgi:hypothetical protein
MGFAPKKHNVLVQAQKLKITATITGLDVDLQTAGCKPEPQIFPASWQSQC